MLYDLVRYIHVDFVYGKRWLGSDGVSANFKVALNITDVTSYSVFGLLNDGVDVGLEAIDEATLGYRSSCFDSIQPKPLRGISN